MKAEILSIGSELTSGQSLDTNCQWLSLRQEAGQWLKEFGDVQKDLDRMGPY